MDVKVDTPFSWCQNCKAFVLESEAFVLESETFYADGKVYETLYFCKNSGICTLCERAREEEEQK